MKSRILLQCVVFVCVSLTSVAAQAQDGEYLFKTYCAICHEASNGEEARGPSRDVLKQMTAERILDVMEKGAMKAQAAERSRIQRHILAQYLSGKPLGSAPLDLIPKSAFCSNSGGSFTNSPTGPAWNGWGASITNTRFQSADAAGLNENNVTRLKLKWAFGYPGASSGGTQPVVVGDRVYVATAEGDVYSLDAKSGCVHWSYQAEAGIRSAITIAKNAESKLTAYFGDQSANAYAVDAEAGKVLWKTKVDEYWRAAITAAPALYSGRLFVPVSSREESQVADPKYPCCKFRGSMVAVDAATGKILWRTYTITEEAHELEKNSVGTQLWGPSGAPIWNSPTIDVRRNVVYSGTGNNYSVPGTDMSDAVVAFDMSTGAIRWVSQVIQEDIWNSSCARPNHAAATCPEADAPDADFSSSPILVDLKNGRQAIIAAAKSGVIYALDPDNKGKILWQARTGKATSSGGVLWGSAVDGEKIYAANNYFDPKEPGATGNVAAFDINTGEKIWSAQPLSCENRKACRPSHAAAVTAIPGVVFSGTFDGRLRAFSARDGKTLWEYDTAREFETVNGIKANGGSMSNAGPTIVNRMMFVNSGYSHHGGIIPGNVLLMFSVE
jgi:polyvinyl alcohol dehydrogenase (cytochrome)